jgi:hypothetical protein
MQEDLVAVRVAEACAAALPESHISFTSTPAASTVAFASATSGTRNARVPGLCGDAASRRTEPRVRVS